MQIKIRDGFTLIEIMMVVIILSLLSAWAVPVYQTVIERGEERNIMLQLEDIRSAFKQYHAKNGSYGGHHGCQDAGNRISYDDLESVYGVKIKDNNAIYDCSVNTAWDNAVCFARSNRGYALRFVIGPQWNGYAETGVGHAVTCCGVYIAPTCNPGDACYNPGTYGMCTSDCFGSKIVGLEIGDGGRYTDVPRWGAIRCPPTCACTGNLGPPCE